MSLYLTLEASSSTFYASSVDMGITSEDRYAPEFSLNVFYPKDGVVRNIKASAGSSGSAFVRPEAGSGAGQRESAFRHLTTSRSESQRNPLSFRRISQRIAAVPGRGLVPGGRCSWTGRKSHPGPIGKWRYSMRLQTNTTPSTGARSELGRRQMRIAWENRHLYAFT